MNPPFLIIEGGLATAPAPRRARLSDKVVRFENPPHDHEPAPAEENSGLHALGDTEDFRPTGHRPAACILDFEYNGVPARHGFIHD